MKMKNKRLLILLFVIVIFCIFANISHIFLKHKICQNLKNRYSVDFAVSSVEIRGDAANFIGYPKNNPAIRFSGMANATDGQIVFDNYFGAFIAEDDSEYISNLLNEKMGEVYVYGVPVHKCKKIDKFAREIAKYVNEPGLTTLHNELYCSNLCFLVFVNTSNASYKYSPQEEYDILEDAVNDLVNKYRNYYGQEICVDLHVYYVDEDKIQYSRRFFQNHMAPDGKFDDVINANYEILIQFGSRNVQISEYLRLTKDEFVEKRERINNYHE